MKGFNRSAWLPLFVILVLATAGCGPKPPAESPDTQTPVFEPPSAVEEAEVVDSGWKEPEALPEEDIIPREPSIEDLNRELQTIYFDFDKYNLKPQAIQVLNQNLAWLRANPEYEIRIEGHCDERGTDEYNLALGDRRATTAKNYLVQRGISASQLRVVSFGEERPVDPRHNESAWSKNRRAEFVIVRRTSE